MEYRCKKSIILKVQYNLVQEVEIVGLYRFISVQTFIFCIVCSVKKCLDLLCMRNNFVNNKQALHLINHIEKPFRYF